MCIRDREWLTQLDPPHSWRYDAIGKPLWSKASGTTRLEAIGEGTTRLHFTETYEVFNPIMRALLERRVHKFISNDNDRLMKAGIEAGLHVLRKRNDQGDA